MNISKRYTSIELVPKYNNHSLGYAPVTVNITGEILKRQLTNCLFRQWKE